MAAALECVDTQYTVQKVLTISENNTKCRGKRDTAQKFRVVFRLPAIFCVLSRKIDYLWESIILQAGMGICSLIFRASRLLFVSERVK